MASPAANELGAHMEEAASRAGLSLPKALSLQSQLENVSGVSGKRAVELLLMADFDVNRAVSWRKPTPTSDP
jgi:hypothetical protein